MATTWLCHLVFITFVARERKNNNYGGKVYLFFSMKISGILRIIEVAVILKENSYA